MDGTLIDFNAFFGEVVVRATAAFADLSQLNLWILNWLFCLKWKNWKLQDFPNTMIIYKRHVNVFDYILLKSFGKCVIIVSFRAFVSFIYKCCSSVCYFTSFWLLRKKKHTKYKTVVRLPNLTYVSEIFRYENLDLLEKDNNEFLWKITNARKNTLLYKLHDETATLPVTIFYKI